MFTKLNVLVIISYGDLYSGNNGYSIIPFIIFVGGSKK